MSYRTNYKKFLSFILAILISCCFCGCGGKGAEDETNSKSVQNSTSMQKRRLQLRKKMSMLYTEIQNRTLLSIKILISGHLKSPTK